MLNENESGEMAFMGSPEKVYGSDSDHPSPDNRGGDIKMSFRVKVFVIVGLVCIGQFFVCSMIGVIRGYSVQSRCPQIIFLIGIFDLLIPFFWLTLLGKGRCPQYLRISYLISFSLIYVSVIGILQGRFYDIGDDLFDKGRYSAAIEYYQKELNTWYLRLNYNYHESHCLRKIDKCLFNIARDHCQDGDFDKAGKVYRQVVVRNDKIDYSKYYLERSAREVDELDRELKNIAVLQEKLAGEVSDNHKAMTLFDIAIAYRRIECDKKAVEQYDIIQTLDIYEGLIENAKKFKAKLL